MRLPLKCPTCACSWSRGNRGAAGSRCRPCRDLPCLWVRLASVQPPCAAIKRRPSRHSRPVRAGSPAVAGLLPPPGVHPVGRLRRAEAAKLPGLLHLPGHSDTCGGGHPGGLAGHALAGQPQGGPGPGASWQQLGSLKQCACFPVWLQPVAVQPSLGGAGLRPHQLVPSAGAGSLAVASQRWRTPKPAGPSTWLQARAVFCGVLRDLGQMGSGVVELMVADPTDTPPAAHKQQQEQGQGQPSQGAKAVSGSSGVSKGSLEAGSGSAANEPAAPAVEAAPAEGDLTLAQRLQQADEGVRQGALCLPGRRKTPAARQLPQPAPRRAPPGAACQPVRHARLLPDYPSTPPPTHTHTHTYHATRMRTCAGLKGLGMLLLVSRAEFDLYQKPRRICAKVGSLRQPCPWGRPAVGALS